MRLLIVFMKFLLWIWVISTLDRKGYNLEVEGFAGSIGIVSSWNNERSLLLKAPLGQSMWKNIGKNRRVSSDVCMTSPSSSSFLPSDEELRNQKSEALMSLADYHDGTWECKEGATSFSISSDVAAGIIRKSKSMPYQTSVSVRLSSSNLKMVETFSWQQQQSNNKDNSNNNKQDSSWMARTREVPLSGHSIDVDSVDASYSVDQALMDLPTSISGSEALVQFGVEHVLAISDDQRIRSFCLYGMDDRLIRVVIAKELRQQPSQSTQQAPLQLLQDQDEEMSNSIERLFSSSNQNNQQKQQQQQQQQMQQLQNAISNADNHDNDNIENFIEYPISIFGLSLGPWLGDAVIRDRSPFYQNNHSTNNNNNNKTYGFRTKNTNKSKKKSFKSASSSSNTNNNSSSKNNNDNMKGFAEWSIGVQKVAMQYKWDFGETIRHVWESGRSMGVSVCPTLPNSSMGIVNEKLMSKRIQPKEDRMLYIDYEMGAYAGFTLGSVYLKVPTFLFFSQMNAQKLVHPFVTQFAVFQKTANGPDPADPILPPSNTNENAEIICSKMIRLYNNNGQLKQGITSFFTLNPISTEADMMDP